MAVSRCPVCFQSGKSVYLQQVGLIAYLALCGSFVPAEAAVVGLLDGIYACVSTESSVTSDMSSFCQESAHMAYMQRHCTGRSLCLIDEYGQGTATDHGMALLTAALECWADRAAACPLVLASTHYHDMFVLGLVRTDEQRVRAYTMTFIDEVLGNVAEAPPASIHSPTSSRVRPSSRSSSCSPASVPTLTLCRARRLPACLPPC